MMRRQRFLIIASIITCYLIQAQGADKYTDENRPYEFGFTIEGQQHRHEEKDKNGIIKGEYGFITADGVYHVTVYATDEQGRFRILSMKNIRYLDYKGLTGPPTSARQPHSLQLPSPKAVTAGQSPISNSIPTPKPQQEFEKISILPPANSCSHCSLPTTSTVAPKIETSLTNQRNGGGNSQYNPSFYPKQESNYNSQIPQAPAPQQGFTQGSNAPTQPNNYNLAQNSAQGPSNGYNGVQGFAPQSNTPAQPNAYNGAQSSPQQPNVPGNYGKPNGFQGFQGYRPQTRLDRQQGQQSSSAENPRMSKQYTGTPDSYTPGQQNPALDTSVSQARPGPNQKPVLTYAQMQIVDKNTDIHAKAPGEKDGLPPGLKEDDMLKLLYTFNYTLGFQAHFEEGFTNGVKRGYYYTTGRNGVRTRIDYVADKDGFHPKLSQEVYDLISDDVPKEETEKDEKYGLKGYEFKWLYFPVETKSQQSST